MKSERTQSKPDDARAAGHEVFFCSFHTPNVNTGMTDSSSSKKTKTAPLYHRPCLLSNLSTQQNNLHKVFILNKKKAYHL